MYKQHEYSLIGGLNRSRIGHVIGMAAAFLSSLAVTAALAVIAYLETHGVPVPRLVAWPLSVAVVYLLLYTLFDMYFWRIPLVSRLLRVPDLRGDWKCIGQTINPDKSQGDTWDATVTIVQSWDRIRVQLKTGQSTSDSVAAALVYDEADGYRLMYNYRNEPRIGETDLKSHMGYAELLFSADLKSADGEYFNGRGRYTFGTMRLAKTLSAKQ